MYGDVPPLTVDVISPLLVPLQSGLLPLRLSIRVSGSVIVTDAVAVQTLLFVMVT